MADAVKVQSKNGKKKVGPTAVKSHTLRLVKPISLRKRHSVEHPPDLFSGLLHNRFLSSIPNRRMSKECQTVVRQPCDTQQFGRAATFGDLGRIHVRSVNEIRMVPLALKDAHIDTPFAAVKR